MFYFSHCFVCFILKISLLNAIIYNEYPILKCEEECKNVKECATNDWLVCSWLVFGELPDMVCCKVMDNNDINLAHRQTIYAQPFCGFRAFDYSSKQSLTKRITSGTNADKNEFPWMASIYRFNQYLCGAAIISDRFLITAAHCFLPLFDESVYSVKIGSNKLGEGQQLLVLNIIIHKSFSPPVSYNDIALIVINKRIHFNEQISALCLPNADMIGDRMSGIMATVIGFGSTKYGGDYAHKLQKIDVPIVDNKECNQLYKNIVSRKLPLGIQKNMICAGFRFGHQDSCQGDSGGPMTVALNNIHYLIGIISFGHKCGERGFPGVYTNVAHYRNWILESIIRK